LLTIALGANVIGSVLITAYTVTTEFVPGRPFVSQPPALTEFAVIAAVVFSGTFVTAVVVFCIWLHRVIDNMIALGSLDSRWSPAGAVARCFIPLMNFVHPLLGVLDAWRGSDLSRRSLNLAARKAIPLPRPMIAWWLLWLGGIWGGNFTEITGTVGAVIDSLKGTVLVAATVLAILVVRQLTNRQDRKNQLISSGELV
jgi:hypothetical protein